MQKSILERWTIVYEATPGLKPKIQEMVDKMQNNLARYYNIRIQNPNVVEVRDLQNFDWKIQNNELCVFVLNSRAKNDALTRK